MESQEMSREQMKRLVDHTRKVNQERGLKHSNEQLQRHIKKKIKTTMIGALAKFEEYFGHLWGHDKPDNEITDDQREMGDVWEEVRTEVLNNGNHQSRAAMEEIGQYTVKFNKFHTEFILRKPDHE